MPHKKLVGATGKVMHSGDKQILKNVATFMVSEGEKIIEKTITEENWRDAVNHVIKEKEKIWVLDNLIEQTIEPIVISLDESSDDSCMASEEDDIID